MDSQPSIAAGLVHELRQELAFRIARLIGAAEKQATAIPRLTLHQRTAPTTSCPITYEPSVMVLAQGSKQVQIGNDIVTYDASHYLLVSVDLPTVTRVSEASKETPCLVASLKLDISIVREFLILRCSKTHVSHVLAGKVAGIPRLTHIAMGRRKLVRREWLDQWMESNKR